MNPENAIEVRNVQKYFKVYEDKGKMLRERIIHWNRNKYEKREVLKGISFDVKKGEAVGLIGSNGCGKSTTLKLLTKILRPNSGSIDIQGKVYSMIELGAGFHPDMSGRENIYINASIFGVKSKEVDKRIDDIIEFSELEEFIDNPVRTYSSGMYMRLAFAVAINMDADILLIDEILAVGDAAFQAKCFNKLREIKRGGTTIVLVSHSTGQIEQLCDRSIWIKDGKIKMQGKPRDIHPIYLDDLVSRNKKTENKQANDKASEKITQVNTIDSPTQEPKEEIPQKRYGNGNAHITKIQLLDKEGEPSHRFDVEDSLKIKVEYSVKQKVDDAVFGIQFFRNDGVACYGTNTRIERIDEFSLDNEGAFIVNIPRVTLVSGKYWLDVAIESGDGFPVDYWKEAVKFEVTSSIGDVDIARIKHEWQLNI